MSKQLPTLADTLFNLATHAQGLSIAIDDLHAIIKAGTADPENLPESQRLLVTLSHHITEAAARLYGPIDQAAREKRIAALEAALITKGVAP